MTSNLSNVSGPDRIEIWPGLVMETKIRIKTQRRLESRFGLPIRKIFKGQWKHPVTGQIEEWPGVDFELLDNLIGLITCLCRQVNEGVTEDTVEAVMDALGPGDAEKFGQKFREYFERLGAQTQVQPSADPQTQSPEK